MVVSISSTEEDLNYLDSILFINGSEPTELSDVSIKKVIKDRFIPIYSEIELSDTKIKVEFEEIQ